MSKTMTGTAVGSTSRFVDERLHSANFVRRALNKVFPDHWSFMIGEIALYSFIILLLTGTYLAFFYTPSMQEMPYQGSYQMLRGIDVSEAYSSTLKISFDVKGGLVLRQIHHWAALLFIAAIVVHLCRIFFTGAFRKPRELNWIIGTLLLVVSLVEGFAGYSLPDDLLSGTGLEIAYAILLSIPVVGTWAAVLIFGDIWPGTEIFGRLYVAHILLFPGIILALITAHMMILWYQKHTQFRGPGHTETNVVGSRLYPSYAAKGQGFFFLVFGVLALLGGLAQINPIWLYGPYFPANVSAGSQPDWYIGWLDGALRLMPSIQFSGFGYNVPFMILFPGVILAGSIFVLLGAYPFIEERWITKDHGYHNLLDRPRDNPTRTAIGAMALTFYTLLWIAGGNDLIATRFSLSIQAISWTLRIGVIVLPPLAYFATKRLCLSLQRSDIDIQHHGIETGTIKRLPSGEFVEVHAPAPVGHGLMLTPVESDRAQPGDAHISVGQGGQVPLSEQSDSDGHGVVGAAGRAVSGFFVKKTPVEPSAPQEEQEPAGQQ